ncbi:fluoride efflux transporter FluC [Serinibacter arcticus]|uniref:Fluoride-specific ion channel FluC n=1 Tax=Serinibacter arcticus TaxID=1655435 RepID=A0A4Z1E3G2_9MICO|nr:CrcB family protein [Serinibacter arcticus]TGO05488.1 CrcB protein [Serinibacter arcticus]
MIVLVALGGAIGAMARYAVDLLLGARWSARRGRGRRGVALAVINITGSLLIGLVAGLALRGLVSDELRTVLATGVLGGYTTFSAASLDVVEQAEREGRAAALRRAIAVPAAAVIACAVGLWLSSPR